MRLVAIRIVLVCVSLLLANVASVSAAPLTALSWSSDKQGASDSGARYSYNFSTATTATLGKVTMTVPTGTSCPGRYLITTGTSLNGASTPDSGNNSITGDVDIRAQVSLDDWTPSTLETLVAKYDTGVNQRSYMLRIGVSGEIQMYVSSDGSGSRYVAGSALGLTDGSTKWIRGTFQANNGSNQSVMSVYTSDNGTDWTLNMTSTVGGAYSIFNSSAPLQIGYRNGDTAMQLAGKVYYAAVYNGINGTLANEFDPSSAAVAASPGSWVASTGEIWSLDRSGSTLPGDFQCSLTVSTTTGIGTGTARLRLYDGLAIYTVTTPVSVPGSTAIGLGFTGFTNTATSGSYSSTITTYNSSGTAVDSGTTGSVAFSKAPLSPTSLAQKTAADVVVSTNGVVASGSVKFTATVADPDNPDTLQLCVEVVAVSVAFTNANTGCGSATPYSGTPVNATYTASLGATTAYHWQARVKDAAGVYSPWVSYGNNSDAVTADNDFSVTGQLTSRTWSSDKLLTGSANSTYTFGATAATTAVVSKVRASVPAGTNGGTNRALDLSGDVSNYVSTADSSANSITGDMDIRAKVSAADWTPTATSTIAGKYDNASNQSAYRLTIEPTGNLKFWWSTTGSNSFSASSSALGYTDGTTHWVRATMQVSDGAGHYVASFYDSPDGTTWNLIGSAVTGGASSNFNFFNSSGPLAVGASNTLGTADSGFVGSVYYVELRNGIGGPVVNKFDPNDVVAASPSTWNSSSSNTESWVINRSGNVPADIAATVTVASNTYLATGTAKLRLIDAVVVYAVTTPASLTSSTAFSFGVSGITNTTVTGTYSSLVITYNNAAPAVAVDSGTTNTVTITGNTAPNAPTGLAQLTTGNANIATGTWLSGQTVKFSATATDTDNPDSLYLCVEKKAIGMSFSNVEDSCGSAASYSGTAVTVTNTMTSIGDATEYHWQARTKDNAGVYSSWVSYDVNAESARDFGIDTTAPSGGTVYDGTTTGVDQALNGSSLSSLSANWGGVNANVSGLVKYEYSIGTAAGGTQTLGWTNNGTATSVTASGLTLRTGVTYYINVRTTDGAGNVSTPISSDGQQVTPTLTFSVSAPLVAMQPTLSNGYLTDTQSSTLTTSTNAYGGYVITASINRLATGPSSATVPAFNGGTYAQPDSWQTGDLGFGYTSNDNSVQGANKFQSAVCPGGSTKIAPGCFAPFTTASAGDIVADHPGPVSSPILNEAFQISYRTTVNSQQTPGQYTAQITYTAIPTF